jgi:CopG family nickel-responsive transcriptional regulator
VTRSTISLAPQLLRQLDKMVAARQLPSRSHAVAEMIHQELLEHERRAGETILAGTVTLVYGNRREPIRAQLARIQVEYLKEVISSQHVFLENGHSLEVLLVQGPGQTLDRLADELRAVRGVKHVKVALTTTVLPPLH